jgi:hypothetical protein
MPGDRDDAPEKHASDMIGDFPADEDAIEPITRIPPECIFKFER